MDGGDIVTLFILALLILLSAYFSATETAFSSLNRIRLKSMAEDGNKRAAGALKLADNYSKLLSTVLVGNNIVNIGATSIATIFFVKHFGNAGATISTIVMTVLVLIFGEISPKTLAKESPEKFAMFSAPFLRVLALVLTPINWLFAKWEQLLAKLFKNEGSRTITEQELLTIVDEAEEAGAIEEQDSTLIRNAIDFNDSRVNDIFTPRVDVSALSIHASKAEVADMFLQTGYTRLPVYDGSMDDIKGVLHLRDFFESFRSQRGGREIAEMITPVVFTSSMTKINELLKILQQNKGHIAVVTDEFGGTKGIVTMEDILEELVGEIWDEHDDVVEEFTQVSPGVFRVAGGADLDRVFRQLGLSSASKAVTVNGWVAEQLGRIPRPGDSFVFEGFFVAVEKVEHNRAIECLFTLRQPVVEPVEEN